MKRDVLVAVALIILVAAFATGYFVGQITDFQSPQATVPTLREP
jgi:hypothetical protein